MEPRGRRPPLRDVDADTALKRILEGTAAETGGSFFRSLVENLALSLCTQGAWVTEYLPQLRRLRALAFYWDGRFLQYEYDVVGTPCQRVVDEATLVHVPDAVVELYPQDLDLARFKAVSYLGVPLLDVDGTVLGNLAVIDTRPLPKELRCLAVFRIFAARASAEHRRLRAESRVRESEKRLSSLINSTMDAVFEVDDNLRISMVNPAGEVAFRCKSDEAVGRHFDSFLTPEGRETLQAAVRELRTHPDRGAWIPGALKARRLDGVEFSAEGSVSCFRLAPGQMFYTIILRDVEERLKAERRIASLASETEYLKEEVKAFQNSHEILGQSKAVMRLLESIAQVAPTDVGVLIQGETGTGKELVARAIHKASRRSDNALIKVNCAAIPSTLIESEFFGHEKGAFTGATVRREGRFALADKGTIFLDEIGELPLDVQVKLLRVLQEREFEPVGSSRTRKIDVRVVAATNRDLRKQVLEGSFRSDLYYRLCVFPIEVPPLRERGNDVILLASTFAKETAREIGCDVAPLSPEAVRKLKEYDWPGNVRELRNVIERAVITSKDGRLDLNWAFPSHLTPEPRSPEPLKQNHVQTFSELRQFERENILRALEIRAWKVAGQSGAARLLGIPPSTLSSRMKALGIRRPAGVRSLDIS